MSPRSRRLCVAGLVGAVLLVLVAASRPADPPTTSFRIVLGLHDKEPTDWSGKVAVADGEAVALNGWRFEDSDAVSGPTQWKCKTRDYIAPGDGYPLDPASGKPKPPPQEPWPNGVVLTVRGAAPTAAVTLPAGEIKFAADDVPLGRPRLFLDGRVRVERLPATSVLRPPAEPKAVAPVQDDYPAFWVRYKTGKQYLAWVAYREEKRPRAPGGARRPGRRLVGAGRGRGAGRPLPRRPGRHAQRHPLGRLVGTARPQLGPLRPALQRRQARRRGAADRRPRPGPVAPHDHRPARPGVAGLAGRPRRQVRHLRPLRRRRRLARHDPRQRRRGQRLEPRRRFRLQK